MPSSEFSEKRPILLLAFAAFASSSSMRVCDPLLPALATSFAIKTGVASQAISAFSIAYGLFQVVYGPLGDRYGKFRLIAWTTLACTLGGIGATLATGFGWLLIFRAATGAAAAAIIPLSMAWIGDNVAYERRQATLARFLIGQIAGIAGGQLIGGAFADTLGWRWALGSLVCVYFVVAALLFAELWRNRGIDRGPGAPRPGATGGHFLAQTLALFSIPWARVVMIAVFLEGMSFYGVLAFVPSFLHQAFGLSLTGAGSILGLYALGGLAYTLTTRQLVAWLGEAGLSGGGGLLLGVAFALLAAGPTWHWALLACPLAGMGFYMLHNTLQINATQMAPDNRGTAVSMFAAALYLSQSAGVLASAAVVDVASPRWLFAASACALPLIGVGFGRAIKRHRARP